MTPCWKTNSLDQCPPCLQRDGLPIAATGLPPLHPNCKCTVQHIRDELANNNAALRLQQLLKELAA
jgi:hypothetical protein